ncbi:hypothetical protein BV20DRAFT_418811 [Pilatotrama ljubarskyi]|nr:hypothetical protein BV20DRAFT_418811 [Pilatotrama ljubarskyi]
MHTARPIGTVLAPQLVQTTPQLRHCVYSRGLPQPSRRATSLVSTSSHTHRARPSFSVLSWTMWREPATRALTRPLPCLCLLFTGPHLIPIPPRHVVFRVPKSEEAHFPRAPSPTFEHAICVPPLSLTRCGRSPWQESHGRYPSSATYRESADSVSGCDVSGEPALVALRLAAAPAS